MLGLWQLRVQLQEHQARRRSDETRGSILSVRGALPVSPPLGRLPAGVRGRDALLTELGQPLTGWRRRGGTWVLTGMGGVGKSTVALAAAERARAHGWRVWWVTASDAASLTGGMLEVLGQLGAPESLVGLVREGEPTAADRTWEFIISNRAIGRRWLLVFDDADDPAVLASGRTADPGDGTGWVRPDLSGMILVTTRHRNPSTWGNGVKVRELQTLDDEIAADVLTDLVPYVSKGGKEPAEDLARRLGGLPLALHLAGTYLASPFARWHTFTDYLQALDSVELPGALADLDDPNAPERRAIVRTWELSLDALRADGRWQARPVLFLLSCYDAATPIPVALLKPELLTDFLSQSEPIVVSNSMSDRGPDWQRRLRDAALYGLATVGLINTAGELGGSSDRAVTLHPVVVDVNRSRLLAPPRSELRLIGVTAVNLLRAACEGMDMRDPADWPVWRRLVPHINALLDWLGANLDAEDLVSLIETAGMATVALWRSGNYAEGERLARASVKVAGKLSGDHPASMLARSQLAHVVAQTRYEEAEQMFRQLLADQERILDKDDPETMASQRVLARLDGLQGRYQEAERTYRGLLKSRELLLGNEADETLYTRHGLAGMVERLGRYEEAESMFRDLLNVQRRILGDDHQECLELRSGLGRCIEDQHRYAEAEQLYRQLLADRQRILGDDHPSTLNTRHSLARVVAAQGRAKEAERLYRQLLADRQRVLGEDHPITMATREFLANMNSGISLVGQPGVAPMEALMNIQDSAK